MRSRFWSGDWPVTSPFGPRAGGFHNGVDIGMPKGTPLYAGAPGKVYQFTDYASVGAEGPAKDILITYADGTQDLLGHLDAWVASGIVAKGQLIAYSGNTGNTSGPHLHFTRRSQAGVISSAIDPLPYLQEGGAMNEILKAIWLTLLQREPSAAELAAYDASPEKRPYTYAQQKLIVARHPDFMNGWNLIDGWDLPRRLNEAKDQVIGVLQPRIDALTKQLDECGIAGATAAKQVTELERESDDLRASLAICEKDLGVARLEIAKLKDSPKIVTDPAELTTGQLISQLISRLFNRKGVS